MKPPAPLPAFAEELILLLEGQEKLDRVPAIQAIEKKHGVVIDFDDLVADYEEFARRWDRLRKLQRMRLEDKMDAGALDGKSSAAVALRGRLPRSGKRTGNDRVVLEYDHGRGIQARRRGW
jgi:hypothetical protein